MSSGERGAITVLVADQVLTLDAKGTIHTPGAVTIEGATIRAVGPPPSTPAGEVVDLRGCVLLPGLVNTHTHTPMWVFRGLTEDVPRGEWLTGPACCRWSGGSARTSSGVARWPAVSS